jgi:hypothetical protein
MEGSDARETSAGKERPGVGQAEEIAPAPQKVRGRLGCRPSNPSNEQAVKEHEGPLALRRGSQRSREVGSSAALYAVELQRRELALQRAEMKAQRDEITT